MGRERWFDVGSTAVVFVLWASAAAAQGPKPRRPLLTNTNIGQVVAPIEPITGDKPPAETVLDVDALRRIDTETERTLASMQGGASCNRIRDASRVTLRAQLFAEHERELSVAAGLLLGAGLIAMIVKASRARSLLALPPLAGALFVGYVAWERVDVQRSAVREGLRACTAELPAPDLQEPSRVIVRRVRAEALIATIRRVASTDHLLGED